MQNDSLIILIILVSVAALCLIIMALYFGSKKGKGTTVTGGEEILKTSFENDKFLPPLIALLDRGHQFTIVARGNSMRPFIEHDRDELIFGPVTRQVEVGDVVLAEVTPGHYVCHRVDAAGDKRLRLRGDGNLYGTEVCNREDVRAMLDGIIRLGKTYELATSRTWKVYSWWWVRLLPVRRHALAFYRVFWLHQVPNRIKRPIKKIIGRK